MTKNVGRGQARMKCLPPVASAHILRRREPAHSLLAIGALRIRPAVAGLRQERGCIEHRRVVLLEHERFSRPRRLIVTGGPLTIAFGNVQMSLALILVLAAQASRPRQRWFTRQASVRARDSSNSVAAS